MGFFFIRKDHLKGYYTLLANNYSKFLFQAETADFVVQRGLTTLKQQFFDRKEKSEKGNICEGE